MADLNTPLWKYLFLKINISNGARGLQMHYRHTRANVCPPEKRRSLAFCSTLKLSIKVLCANSLSK